jgi:hypothetical protein
MKKIMITIFFILTLLSNLSSAKSDNDIFYINRVIISNSKIDLPFNTITPGTNQEIITNNDDVIFYYANIGVINPTKKKYTVEIVCVDKNNKTFVKEKFERKLQSQIVKYIGENGLKFTLITVSFDPKVGALVQGQRIPFHHHDEYFIKLFIDNKLIAVSSFLYYIEK